MNEKKRPSIIISNFFPTNIIYTKYLLLRCVTINDQQILIYEEQLFGSTIIRD
jgi:hypothetical protein